MADHHVITSFKKVGYGFSTVDDAMQQHLDDIGNGDTVADYDTYAAGLTNVTLTKYLTSNDEQISNGSPGNGYAIKQVWPEADLKADIISTSGRSELNDTQRFVVNGWTASEVDINPDTGLSYPEGWHLS